MIDKQFKKEAFKESVKENVKFLYRKKLEEATQEQIFQAVCYTVKDVIIDNWLETQNAYKEQDPKTVYYMSMEFLMGRALGNNLINLTAYKEVKEALDELGLDLNVIEDQEPDPALGNGGLGRLAACFLDSLATLNYSAYGCGIRYRYGMFKQQIKDGYQVEVPDNWLKDGYPFELRRPEYAKEVHFGGYVDVEYDPATGSNKFVHKGYQAVKAVPFDMPIVGYNNKIVNTLRIWDAEPIVDFELDSFDKGDYKKAVEQENLEVMPRCRNACAVRPASVPNPARPLMWFASDAPAPNSMSPLPLSTRRAVPSWDCSRPLLPGRHDDRRHGLRLSAEQSHPGVERSGVPRQVGAGAPPPDGHQPLPGVYQPGVPRPV